MLKELLSEKSPISTTRLMSLVCILCACCIALAGLWLGRDLMGLAALCSAFIAPAFAGKVTQKFMEKNSNQTDT